MAASPVLPNQADPRPAADEATAYDLILAMNTVRVSYGYPALVEDGVINAVAQSTAEIMAANQMSWHIGNISGRLTSAGYGGGAKVWATENFAVGRSMSIDQIMVIWSDASHLLPASTAAYCNIGAGVAKASNGSTYYVLQAAYVAGKSCGDYTSPGGPVTLPTGNTNDGTLAGVPQIIVPVKVAAPDADGKIYHVVEAGQSLWAIAVAYKITIQDLETWNNLSRNTRLQIGQKLFIPSSNTKGYTTPTPVGMIQVSTPEADGKVIHTVQAYQTLSTIAKAYGISVEKILALNNLQLDWPLQIGQKLLIDPGRVTPSPTLRPLSPIQKLTPGSDGKYYHTVQSGESLSWIASLYTVRVDELMGWNGLNGSTILQPGQKLVLQVTPPATATLTPGPATATPSATPVTPTATPTQTMTQAPTSTPTQVQEASAIPGSPWVWVALLGVGGAVVAGLVFRKNMVK